MRGLPRQDILATARSALALRRSDPRDMLAARLAFAPLVLQGRRRFPYPLALHGVKSLPYCRCRCLRIGLRWTERAGAQPIVPSWTPRFRAIHEACAAHLLPNREGAL